jgi:2-C-methyl-D-erythritol 4-phosphate cytidylyltransferase
MDKRIAAIIVAAGKGTRMGSEIPKQYLMIAGKTILDTTISKFEKNNHIDEIILVVNKEDMELVETSIACNYKKITRVVAGGSTRTESVYEGIKNVAENCGVVLIHDGVRPFISHRLINTCIENVYKYGACIPVLDVTDTIKKVENGYVESTLDRSVLKAAQTPQSFEYEIIRTCYEKAAMEQDLRFTDDASIVEYYGYKVKAIEGLPKNFKITTPLDFRIAEIIASIY